MFKLVRKWPLANGQWPTVISSTDISMYIRGVKYLNGGLGVREKYHFLLYIAIQYTAEPIV